MLVDLIQHIEQEDRTLARRSLGLAKKQGIGLFKRRLPPGPAQVFLAASQNESFECSLGPIKSFRLFGYNPEDKMRGFYFECANIGFSVVEYSDGKITANLTARRDYFWLDADSPMNRRAALFAVGVIRTHLNDEYLSGILQRDLKYSLGLKLTPDEVRSRLEKMLERFEVAMPADEPLRLEKASGGRMNASLDPYEDSGVRICHFPHFPLGKPRNIMGEYGAFSFQRDGVLHWLQFEDLNGCDVEKFIVTQSFDVDNYRRTRFMLQDEALKALATIRTELDDDKRLKFAGVLDRLENVAKTLPKHDLSICKEFFQAVKNRQAFLKLPDRPLNLRMENYRQSEYIDFRSDRENGGVVYLPFI